MCWVCLVCVGCCDPAGGDVRIKSAAETAELLDTIDHAKSEGTFDPHIPSRWIATAYENLIYAAWTLVRDGEATPKQAADFAWRNLTTGLQGDTK